MSDAGLDSISSASALHYTQPVTRCFEALVLERATGFVPGVERLRQAEKAEAVGQLAGGLVHDFNNLLSVIVGNLDRVSRILPANTTASRCVADAVTATDCAVALVRRLLAFVRQQPLPPEVIEIDRLLLGLKPLITVAAPGCVIVLDLACAGHSLIDANQLENAVLNLVVNARDAMPDGGRLTVATRLLKEPSGDPNQGYNQREYVVVEVRDSGCGMSLELQGKASEPFFTTKEIGHGTGLGLSQVCDFANQCGGMVRLVSEVGKGTSIALHMPSVDPSVAALAV